MNIKKILFFGAIIVLVLSAVFIKPIIQYSTVSVEDIVVTNTDRECKDNVCRYMVYTNDEVFTNQDTWWFLKFDSSDVQNKLNISKGTKITVKANQLRFPFFSWYRNIIKVM